MNSKGQGTTLTSAGGSMKLKWLATTIKGPDSGKFSSPYISRLVSNLKPTLDNHCKKRRIPPRREYPTPVRCGLIQPPPQGWATLRPSFSLTRSSKTKPTNNKKLEKPSF